MNTQRDVFFTTIRQLYEKGNRDLIILTVDMGCKALNEFKNDENFLINVGPTEQLAIDMSIGLALKGRKPFVYGISSFIFARAWEQIKLLCSLNLPVVIVGSGAALSYDLAGLTHHSIEMLGLLRALPNMTIASISDLHLAQYFANLSVNFKTPLSICLDKHTVLKQNQIYENGEFIIHRIGSFNNPLIITTGVITHYLYDNLSEKYGLVEVFQFPYNKYHLMGMIGNRKVVSVEEGYKIGGLGDSLSFLPNVTKIGFDNFCEAKPREEYWKILLREALNA